MSRDDAFPPVIFTDDGWIMATESPVTAQHLRDKIVGSYAGTGGALGWSVGDHEVYHCEMDSGERYAEVTDGQDSSTYSFVHSATPGAEKRIATNLQSLIESDGGPLTVLAAACRERRIPFFPRVRMNSHYVIDPTHAGYGRFRRERPDLLIGRPGENLPEKSLEWAIRTGKNFAFAEVRDYMETVICETFERFDVDGVEMDFMRHPGWFRVEEARANAYLMTDLLRRVRARLLRTADRRGRRQWSIVRVPPTLADSLRTGLDVEEWMRSGLVDIVVVGGGFIPFETPVDEFVTAAAGTGCLIYGCIEATRYIDDRHLRGLASRWYDDGSDGVYLYNFYTMSAEWNERVFAELSDPAAMFRRDKIHGTDGAGPVSPVEGHSGGFRYASPSTQLPVELQPGFDGEGPRIEMRVSDDVEAARADDALATCVLTVRVPRLGEGDRLDVTLNGEALPWETARVRRGGWTRLSVAPLFWADYPTYPEPVDQDSTLIEFDVGVPPLRKGINTVEIRRALLGPDPIGGSCAQVENTSSLPAGTDPDGRSARSLGGSVVVEGVEITVAYREKA